MPVKQHSKVSRQPPMLSTSFNLQAQAAQELRCLAQAAMGHVAEAKGSCVLKQTFCTEALGRPTAAPLRADVDAPHTRTFLVPAVQIGKTHGSMGCA